MPTKTVTVVLHINGKLVAAVATTDASALLATTFAKLDPWAAAWRGCPRG